MLGTVAFLILAAISIILIQPLADRYADRQAEKAGEKEAAERKKNLKTSKVCEKCGQDFFDFVEYCPNCHLPLKWHWEVEAEKYWRENH